MGKEKLVSKLGLILSVSLLLIRPAVAAEYSFSGFGTVGVSYNDSDVLGYRSTLKRESSEDLSFNTDTLLGLQANIEFDDKLDAVVQAVFLDRVSNRLSDSVEWAFIRYRINRNSAVRVGRINTDLYLLSEYRNVRYAYPWARPPSELYNLVSTVSSMDGLEGRFNTNLGPGFLEMSLALGQTTQVLNDGTETIEAELKHVYSGSVSYRQNDWLLRASLVDLTIEDIDSSIDPLISSLNNIPSALWPQAPFLANYLDPHDAGISYAGLGYQYENNRIILSSELGYSNSEWGAMPQETFSGYASLGYISGDITYYLSLAKASTHQDPVMIESPLVMSTELEELAYYAETYQASIGQQTFSAGLKWSFDENMNLNIQWDRTTVEKGEDLLWTRENPLENRERVNLFSVSLNMVF